MKVKRELLNAAQKGASRTILAQYAKSSVRHFIYPTHGMFTAVVEIIENDGKEETKAACCRKTASPGAD